MESHQMFYRRLLMLRNQWVVLEAKPMNKDFPHSKRIMRVLAFLTKMMIQDRILTF